MPAPGTCLLYTSFVVLLRIFARLEFQFLIRVGLHQPGFYGFLNFIVQFFNRTDADFFRPVFGTPDRQRRSPVATTAQVPVLKVFQPFAEDVYKRQIQNTTEYTKKYPVNV